MIENKAARFACAWLATKRLSSTLQLYKRDHLLSTIVFGLMMASELRKMV